MTLPSKTTLLLLRRTLKALLVAVEAVLHESYGWTPRDVAIPFSDRV